MHRGTEKLIEYKTYTQSYLMLIDWTCFYDGQEHCYSLLIEKLLQIKALKEPK